MPHLFSAVRLSRKKPILSELFLVTFRVLILMDDTQTDRQSALELGCLSSIILYTYTVLGAKTWQRPTEK